MHASIYDEKCGLSEAQIAELPQGAPSAALWNEKERAIIRMVDELHALSSMSGSTWAALRTHWPHDQIVELILASGFYHMAAFFLDGMAVPLEEGSRRFPAGISHAVVPA
jgi:4-carboxymuconolactone decarboxylase